MLKNALTGEAISNEELSTIAQMVEQQLNWENVVETLEQQLTNAKEKVKDLSEIKIPEALLGLGLSEVKLSNGAKVTVSKYYSASITGEHQQEAFAWLTKAGCDDIIKNEVKLSFGKGENDLAIEVANELRKRGLSPEQKTFVHPMTLKSFVKERMENNQELPTELFSVYVGNKTKIQQPK